MAILRRCWEWLVDSFFGGHEINETESQRLEREEHESKESDAKIMLEKLYAERNSMSAGEIIETLNRIHTLHRIPRYQLHEGGDKDLWFYDIMNDLRHSATIGSEHVAPLVEMLFWPEIRERHDCSSRFCIISVVEKFPTPAILPKLRLHQRFLDNLKQHSKIGTHFYADLYHEIDRVGSLVTQLESM